MPTSMNCSLFVVVVLLALTTIQVVSAGGITVDENSKKDFIELQFHLTSAKHTEETVEELFSQRTTPGSPSFRQHLSQTELVDVVSAPTTTIDAIVAFAERHGATRTRVFNMRDIVSCQVSAQSNYAAFGLSNTDFQLAARGRALRRTVDIDGAALGVEQERLYSILAIVYGQDELEDARLKLERVEEAPPSPYPVHSPHEIRGRYKIPMTPAKAPVNFTSGTAQFVGESFFKSTIDNFSTHLNLTIPEVFVHGPNPTEYGRHAEGTMDVELVTSISGGVNTHWIAQNSSNPGLYGIDYSKWVEELLAIPNPPSSVSISYAIGYDRYNATNNMALLEADNRAFRKVALRGISLFAGSGDNGPAPRTYTGCDKFIPMWPTSSPYITSVGGTNTNTTHGPEFAWSHAGGGFSTMFPAPSYQKKAVAEYLANPNVPSTSFFNKTGRAYPDVSALAMYILSYFAYKTSTPMWGLIGGTSCAGPQWAALITRLNLERQRQGKPNVGFLNPMLYKLGRVGQDIQNGGQIDSQCSIKGFPAAEGWDAVTGLGTPDFEFLLKNL